MVEPGEARADFLDSPTGIQERIEITGIFIYDLAGTDQGAVCTRLTQFEQGFFGACQDLGDALFAGEGSGSSNAARRKRCAAAQPFL
jgi:hypothetical protein